MPEGEQHELDTIHPHPAMEEEEREDDRAGPSSSMLHPGRAHNAMDDDIRHDDMTDYDTRLNRRTLWKLDLILLPFLSLLFLLNSLDRSNVGNAETAHFTHDTGLAPGDLNESMAYFFAFFVALQPVGAALGRRIGMARWVPACMSLWGLCTCAHILVRAKWQLILLRVVIACLEAGFYPTAVSYLSLFYTKYEFAVRLGFFYGQYAVAGALGGVLSWAVFKHFPDVPATPELPPPTGRGLTRVWRSWEVLFMIEGSCTIIVALVGFAWLPHSADTAWFLGPQERQWAEERIKRDLDDHSPEKARNRSRTISQTLDETAERPSVSWEHIDEEEGEAHRRLLDEIGSEMPAATRKLSTMSTVAVTADTGLSRHDVLAAVLSPKIWHLLVCNLLSAIPTTAFSVFLPLVVKQLSPSLNLSPAASNLLSAPPFACGALVLFAFARWSDQRRERLVPILWGLGLLLIGLTLTVMVPRKNYVLRYIALCVLLSGSFVASPLTVAWLAGNTPEPGKRAILLGLNGWGNLAGVFSSLLFRPGDEASGYVEPFIVTLLCVLASFTGFVAFRQLLVRENRWREVVVAGWTAEEKDREDLMGDADVPPTLSNHLLGPLGWNKAKKRLDLGYTRKGDEKLTFRYGL